MTSAQWYTFVIFAVNICIWKFSWN